MEIKKSKREAVLVFLMLAVFPLLTLAQKGEIRGKVYSLQSNEAVPFVSVAIQGTSIGSMTDSAGNFVFKGVIPGFVRLVVSSVGYETTLSPEIQVQGNQTSFVDLQVRESTFSLREVTVRPNRLLRRIESPVSSLSVGVQELEKSAGANRDVSKVLQVLPGVAAMDPSRNDLIVRGGGPSENVFYLDGIQIPVINHFATQGSSGGAIGAINPDFVREITFYTGAFPANRTNALSSVMEIRQKDGSKDKIHTKLSVGASDAAITVDGPINKKSTFIASARQSYLQFLFKALGLPFLPTYNDFQVKYKYEIDSKNEITLIGLGAIDNMKLNTELADTGDDTQKYILSYLPVYKQWNYTLGLVYKHFGDNFSDSWIISRNMLRNENYKHTDNDKSKPKTSNYLSDEAENKLRFEREFTHLPVRLKVGAGLQYAHYKNDTYRLLYYNNQVNELNYNTNLNLFGYQAFAQVSDEFLSDKLGLSFGVNMVANDFNNNMKNPLNQLSPRFSISYAVSDQWSISGNIGRYAEQPAYTTLGFKNSSGEYANRNENLKYIIANHFIAGIEYKPAEKLRFSAEGFYKKYLQYPMSVSDGISIASKGADYGEVGDEQVVSSGKGRAYGAEFLLKIADWHNLNVTSTYTLFRSEFTNMAGDYLPSSWDTRHLLNLIASYKFGKSWNLAMRWRHVGGEPYSPIDWQLSTNREAWNVKNQAYTDYSNFNSLRLKNAHALDIRIDKEYYFKKWLLNLYMDVQNAYNFKSERAPIYTNKDAKGNVIPDANGDPAKQGLRILDNTSGTILPTIGIIIKM
ncbi:MAG: hypothetical protein BGN96_09950 [Bacteroidales bacterium 45-6]|nr:MAG: hypothetical protein BGN96_09950 [Bacteroidales bacterium 45-6]